MQNNKVYGNSFRAHDRRLFHRRGISLCHFFFNGRVHIDVRFYYDLDRVIGRFAMGNLGWGDGDFGSYEFLSDNVSFFTYFSQRLYFVGVWIGGDRVDALWMEKKRKSEIIIRNCFLIFVWKFSRLSQSGFPIHRHLKLSVFAIEVQWLRLFLFHKQAIKHPVIR